MKYDGDEIKQLELRFVDAWTGANSTPFIVDAPILLEDEERATQIVRHFPIATLFKVCPTIACWGTLKGLSESYDGGSRHVYHPISAFLQQGLSENWQRDSLKTVFKRAGRGIGLPVVGSDPTDVFFGAVGPVKKMYKVIAEAFVRMALSNGVPAVEDTAASRTWQRKAVGWHAPDLARLQKAVNFDVSAYMSRRFEAWRQGGKPISPNEEEMFEAYDRAARSYGRTRKDLVGPPVVCWVADRLGLQTEKSGKIQTVAIGSFSQQLPSGAQTTFGAPWDTSLRWTCRGSTTNVQFAPEDDEVLVFAADDGRLIKRGTLSDTSMTVACVNLVVLAAANFECASFGEAIPAADDRFQVAWIEAGESIDFANGHSLVTEYPSENAIWIEGQVVCRSDSRALYSSAGCLVGRMDPDVGGKQRILRARLGDEIKFTTFSADIGGDFSIPFADLGFHRDVAPNKATFEVLAPGAAGDLDARSEITVAAWLWPAFAYSGGEITRLPLPSNFSSSHSRGLRPEGGELWVDLRADGASPVLALATKTETREFKILTRAETVLHNLVNKAETVRIPRGKTVTLGNENRHDTFRIKSGDKNCDLLALGTIVKRPFRGGGSYEINASELATTPGADDRIALKREDGTVTVFARLRKVDDPVEVSIQENDQEWVLRFKPAKPVDAVKIISVSADGTTTEGEISIGRLPVDGGMPDYIICGLCETSGEVSVTFEKAGFLNPTRAEIHTRSVGSRLFAPVIDASGYRLAVGLGPTDPIIANLSLSHLAMMTGKPCHFATEAQMNNSVGAAFSNVVGEMGTGKLVGRIKPVLAVLGSMDATPRHDLVGVAPWIFEAPSSALSDLPDESGLAHLGKPPQLGSWTNTPDPEGRDPLLNWLSRLQHDVEIPAQVGADALSNALRSARFRMRNTDLRVLLGNNSISTVAAAIIGPWREADALLRTFDKDGGGDDRITRIAGVIESFARACATKRVEKFVQDIVFRTGFERADVGRTLTLMLRAEVEVFAYFKTLWTANRQEEI